MWIKVIIPVLVEFLYETPLGAPSLLAFDASSTGRVGFWPIAGFLKKRVAK